MQRLSHKEQMFIVRLYFEGLSYDAIASKVGVGKGTVANIITELKAGKTPFHIFNTFENITFSRGNKINTYRSHLLKMGAREVHLAGSGPALFVLIKDRGEAKELYQRCQDQEMDTYLVETKDYFD